MKELIRMQKEFPAASNCYNRKEKIEIIKITKEDKTDKKNRGNKIYKIADSIKRNVNNGSKIWEVKRRVIKKNTVTKQIN